MQVTDVRVQTLGDGRDAHLAFEHRVSVVENRVHGVAGVTVTAAVQRLSAK